MKECADWSKLNRYAKKYGEEIEGEDFSEALAFNYDGDLLDYIVQINGINLRIFPYRKIRH